jgi:hypothetical protein
VTISFQGKRPDDPKAVTSRRIVGTIDRVTGAVEADDTSSKTICFSWGCLRICPCSLPLRAIPCMQSKTTIATRNNRGFGDG